MSSTDPPVIAPWPGNRTTSRAVPQPAPPGIEWKPRRVEVIDGIPIMRVSGHCVVVPLMAMMMFCKIRHIEASGHLLDRMTDPRDPSTAPPP
jgi:hypothetical protein